MAERTVSRAVVDHVIALGTRRHRANRVEGNAVGVRTLETDH
jgi:hypothetical protein